MINKFSFPKIAAILIVFCIALLIAIFALSISFQFEPKEPINKKTTETYSNLFFSYEVIRYPSFVDISPISNSSSIGFDLDTDRLNFGLIIENGSISTRQINLTILDEKKYMARLQAWGNIAPLIKFSENKFLFSGKKSIYVSISSEGRRAGNYTGEVIVTLAKSRWMDFILGY